LIRGTKVIDTIPIRERVVNQSIEKKERLIIKAQLLASEALEGADEDINDLAQIKVENFLVKNVLRVKHVIHLPRQYDRRKESKQEALAKDVLREIATEFICYTTEGKKFVKDLTRILTILVDSEQDR
jgi:hypothetical protein